MRNYSWHDREDYGSTRFKWFLRGAGIAWVVFALVFWAFPREIIVKETKILEREKVRYMQRYEIPNWCL